MLLFRHDKTDEQAGSIGSGVKSERNEIIAKVIAGVTCKFDYTFDSAFISLRYLNGQLQTMHATNVSTTRNTFTRCVITRQGTAVHNHCRTRAHSATTVRARPLHSDNMCTDGI